MSRLTRTNLYHDLALVSAFIEKGTLTTPDVWRMLFISAVWPLSSTIFYLYAYYDVFIRGFSVDTSLIFITSNIRLTLLIVILLASCLLVFSCTFKIVTLYNRINKLIRNKSISLRHLEKMAKLAALITFTLNLTSAFLGVKGYDIFLYFSPFIILLMALVIIIAGVFNFIRFGLIKVLVAIFFRVMTLSENR